MLEASAPIIKIKVGCVIIHKEIKTYFDCLLSIDKTPILGIKYYKGDMPYCCQVKTVNFGTDNLIILDDTKLTNELVQKFISKMVDDLLNDLCGGVFAYVPIDDELKLVLNYFKSSTDWEEIIKTESCSIFWAEGLHDGYRDDDDDDDWW